MKEEFDASTEAHLDELLARASKSIKEDTPISRRIAGMLLLDYYQALLSRTAAKINVDLRGLPIQAKISRLRSSIGGLNIDHLEGLDKLRNDTLYHHEYRMPTRKILEHYFVEAIPTKDVLDRAVATAIEKETVMPRVAQRLLATANELDHVLHIQSSHSQEPWKAKIERARVMARENPKNLGEDGINLLVDIASEIRSIGTANDILGSMNEPQPPPEDYEPDYPEPNFDAGDFYPEPTEPQEPDYSDDEPQEPDHSDYEPPESTGGEEPREQDR